MDVELFFIILPIRDEWKWTSYCFLVIYIDAKDYAIPTKRKKNNVMFSEFTYNSII